MPTTHLKRLYFDTIVYTHAPLEYLVEQYEANHAARSSAATRRGC